ncbi:electron transport complex subunit RsxG [Salinimonas sp. HHU 13199]|uniref:Ion-translocating oxidoreductase complex subunit G n=1 Tax=Salinimonas profundi TaxID=2729140 RepID=A0ABR8LG22_9ALTE|nr:electron transport complex subunit RsxG [Salinimonas profundi]MBD3585205.1 electron transport complex subunit RsxG [Salinimonas profundi]
MFKTLATNGGMLGTFAVITTALISLTFIGTEDRIAQQQRARLLSVLNEVVPASIYDNKLYADCTVITADALGTEKAHRVYRARNDETPVALVLQTTAPNGYSGNIELVVGVDTSMTVLGVRTLTHQETPGLGDKIELAVSDWIRTFSGKTFDPEQQQAWQVKKDGGQFDQFTGATITPRAVVGAVRRTLDYVIENQTALFAQPANCSVSQ